MLIQHQAFDKRKFLLAGLFVLLFLFCFQIRADAQKVTNTDGTYSWYDSKGRLVKNKWISYNKKTYYADEKGVLATGRVQIKGKYYYFKKTTGEMLTKTWIKSGKKYYYAKKNGVLYTSGKYKIGSYTYYFNKNSVRKTGLKTISGKKYYFDPNNAGRMVTKKWVTIDGKYYRFNKSGVMRTNAWIGKRYVGSDGAALTGLQTIGGKIYYFSTSSCKKVTDTEKTVNDVTYYFDSSGVGTAVTSSRAKPGCSVESTYYTDPVVDDETLLAALIYCEAGNQSYTGQLAVGYVVTNRMYSSRFVGQDSIAEVIYADNQFATAYNGALTKALKGNYVSSSCQKAAKEVLSNAKAGSTPKLTIDEKSTSFPYVFFCTKAAFKSYGLKASHLVIGDHYFFSNWC